MKGKMSVMGVGAKILFVLLVALAVFEGLSLWLSPRFRIAADARALVWAGAALAVVGFALNLVAAWGMLRAHRAGRLATGGLYALFAHPMYVFQILITLPGLFLLFNSWLALLTILPTFVAYKVFSKEEERHLERQFGEQYVAYRKRVIVPFL